MGEYSLEDIVIRPFRPLKTGDKKDKKDKKEKSFHFSFAFRSRVAHKLLTLFFPFTPNSSPL